METDFTRLQKTRMKLSQCFFKLKMDWWEKRKMVLSQSFKLINKFNLNVRMIHLAVNNWNNHWSNSWLPLKFKYKRNKIQHHLVHAEVPSKDVHAKLEWMKLLKQLLLKTKPLRWLQMNLLIWNQFLQLYIKHKHRTQVLLIFHQHRQ